MAVALALTDDKVLDILDSTTSEQTWCMEDSFMALCETLDQWLVAQHNEFTL